MKHIIRITIACAVLCGHQVFGQVDLGSIMKGSAADASYLAQGYLDPMMKSIGGGLSQGWYNTAAPHKPLGFDITASVSLISFPSSDLTYHVDNNKLTTLKITAPASGNAPTFIGSGATADLPTYDNKSGPSAPFTGPPGVDLKKNTGGYMPLPIANIGIGLPLNSELKFRYLPTWTPSKGTNLSLFGVGLMHDIKHYIPGIKMVPIDLSVFVGYTTFKTDVAFDPTNNPSQIGKSQFSSTTIQALIGKKFSVLTLYGSVGYNFSSGSYKVTGTYDTGVAGVKMTDPINISSSISGPRATAGLRLKFAIFTLHADYTFQRYNTLTFGFGFSVR